MLDVFFIAITMIVLAGWCPIEVGLIYLGASYRCQVVSCLKVRAF